MDYMQKGLDLALVNSFTKYICEAYLLQGDWQVMMARDPDLAYGLWAKAAKLDDEVIGRVRPRSFRRSLAKGAFVRMLLRAWKKAAETSKIAIARSVAEGLGREADEVRSWIELFERVLSFNVDAGVMGPISEDYAEDSLKSYFEECQLILLEAVDSDDGMTFWKLERDDINFLWRVQRELVSAAAFRAAMAGSARRRGLQVRDDL
jgi:hypothetical protein